MLAVMPAGVGFFVVRGGILWQVWSWLCNSVRMGDTEGILSKILMYRNSDKITLFPLSLNTLILDILMHL